MPCHEPIADAKASFVAAVKEGISALMEQCGYSRERATSVLMRELNRGGPSLKPSDQEIFDTMKRYNIGIEEATRTLIIGKVLLREMVNRGPAQAIELLASKIALRNLLYDSSSDEDPASDDDLAIRPELRVEPLSRMERHVSNRGKSSSSTQSRKPKASKTARLSRMKTPTKNSTPGRKRSIDEMSSSAAEKKDTSTFPTRERLDSVSAEVDAKIAKQSNEDSSSNDTTSSSVRNTTNVRAKRALRGDEAENIAPSSSHKRIRQSEG